MSREKPTRKHLGLRVRLEYTTGEIGGETEILGIAGTIMGISEAGFCHVACRMSSIVPTPLNRHRCRILEVLEAVSTEGRA